MIHRETHRPEARRLPSGLKAMQSLWPWRVRSSHPVCTSQTFTSLAGPRCKQPREEFPASQCIPPRQAPTHTGLAQYYPKQGVCRPG
jgi:hypothetical protein